MLNPYETPFEQSQIEVRKFRLSPLLRYQAIVGVFAAFYCYLFSKWERFDTTSLAILVIALAPCVVSFVPKLSRSFLFVALISYGLLVYYYSGPRFAATLVPVYLENVTWDKIAIFVASYFALSFATVLGVIIVKKVMPRARLLPSHVR